MIRAGARGYSPPEMARGIMSLAGARARREGHRRRHWNATERERERERGRTGAWSGRVGWGGVALVGVEMGRARAQARRGVWRGCGAGSDHAFWCVCFVLFRVGLGRCTRGGGGGGACLLFVCSLAASAVRPLGFGVERSSHLVGLRLGFIFLPWATGSVL